MCDNEEEIKDEQGRILRGGRVNPEEDFFEELFENVNWQTEKE